MNRDDLIQSVHCQVIRAQGYMEDLFDAFCKEVGRQVGRRNILSLAWRGASAAVLARVGLGTASAQSTCTSDVQCGAGNWCNNGQCTPKLANGLPIPNTPPFNGQCTVTAGARVCLSGVCDANDNECGYADGDGPCNTGNASVVCRSGVCGASGLCIAPGGCATNADCSSSQTCVGSGGNGVCLQPNSGASVATSGWLFSRVTQQFSGSVTVTNTGGAPINAPIVVVLNSLSSGITLTNPSGTLGGAPYILLQSSGTLAPAGSVQATLQFSDPAKGSITFAPVVYTK